MSKRKRLYKKKGMYTKRGLKFSEEMTKAIDKLLNKHPNYDLMDMERVIVRTTAYVSTMKILRENTK